MRPTIWSAAFLFTAVTVSALGFAARKVCLSPDDLRRPRG
jgi:hypothetical protein